ncbi:hypothetical protein OH77DRAFT_1437374 [Trametes cingulata]|nr:hypothetical protein OH77DRAFT_1437374 [Trametes cingulata]
MASATVIRAGVTVNGPTTDAGVDGAPGRTKYTSTEAPQRRPPIMTPAKSEPSRHKHKKRKGHPEGTQSFWAVCSGAPSSANTGTRDRVMPVSTWMGATWRRLRHPGPDGEHTSAV